MKNTWRALIVIAAVSVLGFWTIGILRAAPANKAKEAPADKAKTSKSVDKAQLMKKAQDKLNNTSWQIELKEPGAGENARVIKDTLRFSGGKVESNMLLSEGFPTTNFSIRIKGEKLVIWETMQTSEKKGIVFWRGDINADFTGSMTGMLSRHITDKDIKNYMFSSAGMEQITEAPVIREEPQTVKEEIPAANKETAPVPVKKEAKAPAKKKEPAPVKKEEAAPPAVQKEEAPVVEEEEVKLEDEKIAAPAEEVPGTPDVKKEEPKKKKWF